MRKATRVILTWYQKLRFLIPTLFFILSLPWPLLPQPKVRFLKIPFILTITALPTTVVATATLVVVAGSTVVATMAPPMILLPGSRSSTC